jgi:hypothetical protein
MENSGESDIGARENLSKKKRYSGEQEKGWQRRNEAFVVYSWKVECELAQGWKGWYATKVLQRFLERQRKWFDGIFSRGWFGRMLKVRSKINPPQRAGKFTSLVLYWKGYVLIY